jgi:hypothetical protein
MNMNRSNRPRSNRPHNPNQFLKGLGKYFTARRLGHRPDGRGGAINDCWRPSNEASKEDLREWHREDLKLRRRRQLEPTSQYRYSITPNKRAAIR